MTDELMNIKPSKFMAGFRYCECELLASMLVENNR